MNRIITTIEIVALGGLPAGTMAEFLGNETAAAEFITGGLALFVIGALAEGIYHRRQHHNQLNDELVIS